MQVETLVESQLVDALREQAFPTVSLVALQQGIVVGHIFLSPVNLEGEPDFHMMGLAPMAVSKPLQRQGIGSALVHAGLRACRDLGALAVIVLGHSEYYPKFGFQPASYFQITSAYDVPEEVFMAIELQPGALQGKAGRASYHPVFSEL